MARDQFAQSIGLRDVVVGAHFEHEYRVDLFTLRAHDDDRHLAARADLAADVESRHLGQHEIEQHEVEGLLREERDGLLAVARDGDVEALAVETDRQRVDERLLVLDEQEVDALVARSLLAISGSWGARA